VLFSIPKLFDSFSKYYTNKCEFEKKYGYVTDIIFDNARIKVGIDNPSKRCFIEHPQYFPLLKDKMKSNIYISYLTENRYDNEVLELLIEGKLIFSYEDVRYSYFNLGLYYLGLCLIHISALIYSIIGIKRGYRIG
jgi:hypothetical protein